MPPEEKSKVRQRISELEADRDQALERILEERGPLLRGSVGERARVCGHPQCRCAVKGELHVSSYLSIGVAGATRQHHVPAEDLEQVQEKADRYRRVRRARARLVDLAREQIKLVDRLINALLSAYPSDKPVEPAGRRGPHPKKGRHGGR